MLRNKANGFMGGVLLALALVAGQGAGADGAKVSLARHPKVGAVTTYKATIKANIQGMDFVLTETQKQTIKSVKENGNVVTVSESLGATINFNGNDQEQKASPPTTQTRDKLGKLLDLSQDQSPEAPFGPEVQRLLASISDLLWPDKDVAEGESWETLFDNPAVKGQKVKVKTTFVGTEKVDGVDFWKFKQAAEAAANADGATITNEATVWVNPKDGQMERVDAKVKGIPVQMMATLDLAMELRHVKTPAAAAGKGAE